MRYFILAVLATFSVSLAQAYERAAPKEWTFLIFMNGFNNLDSFATKDLNEIEKVGSTNQVNVVVQWASYRAGVAKRLLVQKDNDAVNVTSPIVEDIGRVDMGDHRNLVEFVKWAVDRYPARKYFIDVWNHGSGWHKNRLGGVTKDISNDDYSGNSITTEQLGQAIRDLSAHIGRKIDIYGSDACLMGMAEVAAEMKDSVHVYLGSQDLEPADGWPYDRILEKWNQIPNASARDVAQILVREYAASYPGRSGITQGAYDMSKFGALTASIRELSSVLQSQPSDVLEKVLQSAQATQSFFYEDYKDVGDFVRLLEVNTTDAQISRTVLRNVKRSVNDLMIANATSADMNKSTGVAFWLPVNNWSYTRYADRYGALQFNSDTNWKDAIRSLF